MRAAARSLMQQTQRTPPQSEEAAPSTTSCCLQGTVRAPAAAYRADCLSVFYLADALHDDAYGSLAYMMRALWLCDTSPTPSLHIWVLPLYE